MTPASALTAVGSPTVSMYAAATGRQLWHDYPDACGPYAASSLTESTAVRELSRQPGMSLSYSVRTPADNQGFLWSTPEFVRRLVDADAVKPSHGEIQLVGSREVHERDRIANRAEMPLRDAGQ